VGDSPSREPAGRGAVAALDRFDDRVGVLEQILAAV
jgi:hypothetical protein